MKKITVIIAIAIAMMFLNACKQDGGTGKKITPSGYEYVMHKKVKGNTAKPGDWVSFSIEVEADNGKILQPRQSGPGLPAIQIVDKAVVTTPTKANPVEELLSTVSVGDSLTMFMPVDSLGPMPNPQLEGINIISYNMTITEIESDVDRKARIETERLAMESKSVELKERETEVAEFVKNALADYKAGKATVVKKDGVEVIIHEAGDGKVVASGNKTSMQYYGVLKSDGSMFDNSFKRGRAFTFTVGRGEVIKGWDVGIPGLKKGAKATLIIPYALAYGEADRPTIPSKSDLVFYVEVEDVN